MIITHSAKTHMDDFLAVSLASHAMEDRQIKRVKNSEVQDAIKNMAELDIMIDIGGVLDPSLRVFDHHQDRNLGASFVHVAKYFNFKLPNDSLWGYFSDVDTKGPEKARKIHNMSLEETDAIHEIVQPILRTWDLVLPEGTIDTELFADIGAYFNAYGFVLNTLVLKCIRIMVKKAYPEQFSEAIKQIAKEKKQKQRAIEALEYAEVGNYIVAIHKSDLYLSHADTGTPVTLTLNQRANKPCLIVDTEVVNVNELLELLGNPPTVFVHANGFLAVIDDTWGNVVNTMLSKGA